MDPTFTSMPTVVRTITYSCSTRAPCPPRAGDTAEVADTRSDELGRWIPARARTFAVVLCPEVRYNCGPRPPLVLRREPRYAARAYLYFSSGRATLHLT